VPPRTPTEKILATIWAEVLELQQVGIHDNFFSIGGDSIKSLQVVARASQRSVKISVRLMFGHQTVRELAAVATSITSVLQTDRDVHGPAPLIPIQCWFFEQPGPLEHFNQSVLLEMPPGSSEERIRQAFSAICIHHDALRMRFRRSASPGTSATTSVSSQWAQETVSEDNFHLRRVSMAHLGEDEQARILAHESAALQQIPNPVTGPMLAVAWFDAGPEQPGRLLIVIHHLVIDGVSWRIVLEDLLAVFGQLEAGAGVQLPAKTTSFLSWARRLTAWSVSPDLTGSLGRWQSGDPADVSIPLDRPLTEGANTYGTSAVHTVSLSPDISESHLVAAAAAYHCRVDELLIAALALAIVEWRARCGPANLGTSHDIVTIDVEGHGRDDLFDEVDVTRTVGWFTTIFPVLLRIGRVDLAAIARGEPVAGELLRAVKDQFRKIAAQGGEWGILRYLNESTAGGLEERPRAQVLFNYLGSFAGLERSGWRLLAAGSDSAISGARARSHLLELNALIERGALQLHWRWCTLVHYRRSIEVLAERFRQFAVGLIQHCLSRGAGGFTTADFPLIALNDADVRTLQAQYPDLQTVWPLTPLQHGLAFHWLEGSHPGAYLLQVCVELSGAVDSGALQTAFDELLSRHAILRIAVPRGMSHLQVVRHGSRIPWQELDWTGLSETAFTVAVSEFLGTDRARGFSFETGPMIRATLLRRSAGLCTLVVSYHHILLDGWSVGLLFKDLLRLYQAAIEGRPLVLGAVRSYEHYLRWLQRRDRMAAVTFWRERLAGSAEPCRLTLPAPSAGEEATNSWRMSVPEGLTQQLETILIGYRVTLNTLLQGTWALLLSRYTGRSPVIFGVATAGRPAELPGVEELVGLFINTLPRQVSVPSETSLAQWLQALQIEQTQELEQGYLPLWEIQRLGGFTGTGGLFDTLLVFENYPVAELSGQSRGTGGLDITSIDTHERAHYLLDVFVIPGKELLIRFGFDGQVLSTRAVRRLADHWLHLLEQIAIRPERSVGSLSLLREAERGTLLDLGAATQSIDVASTHLHELFQARVRSTPKAIAVACAGEFLSYQQLEEQSNQLAHHLQSLGIGPEGLVGVCLDRSPQLLVALLAVLKSGGAYVPLDSHYPAARLRHMIADAVPRAILTQTALVDSLTGMTDAALLILDTSRDLLGAYPKEPPFCAAGAANCAYVLYTSGSTGQPKGVGVSRSSLVNFVCSMASQPGFAATDVLAAVTTLAFDIAGLELYLPLIAGGRIELVTREVASNGPALAALLHERCVTVLQATPATWRMLLESGWRGRPGLRAWCGGDRLPGDLAEPLLEGCEELWNLYGPTETTIWSTVERVRDHDVVTIGRPIANTRIYVVSSSGCLLPEGVAGEIWIGGAGVARGYHGRPDLTAERFVPDLFHPDGCARIYRTGDLGRWGADGRLEHLGRLDHQVKVRGFRIELGEIEAVLREQLGVRDAVVLAREDLLGQKRLVAYIVEAGAGCQSDQDLNPAALLESDLRRALRERLPDYMLPAVYVMLDSLPLTPNGKVDRQVLPAPDSMPRDPHARARTPVEAALEGIWCEVLGLQQVGVHDHFFEIGGDSITSLLVASRASERGLPLSARDLFECPSLAQLALRVENRSVAHPPAVDESATTSAVEFLPASLPAEELAGLLERVARSAAKSEGNPL
jgi:amino acid adenylation domain-containing protein/non-ribosomal peptide synthase protein (TIGR01720 family)